MGCTFGPVGGTDGWTHPVGGELYYFPFRFMAVLSFE